MKKKLRWFGIGFFVLVFLVIVGAFFAIKTGIKLPGFMDSILSNFGIEDVDYVGGMQVKIESYINEDIVNLEDYDVNTDVLAGIFSKFGYPGEYTDLMMFPSTKYISPKTLTIEFRDIGLLSQESKDKLVFQTFSNEELLLGYESKYISNKSELVYMIYVSEGQLRNRLASYGKSDVVSSLTYNLIDVVQLGLYHEDGNEYNDKYNLEILEEIRENPLFVVKKGILGRLNEWIVRPVYAEVRCIGQWSCPQATRVCTCSISGYNLECSSTGQSCGPGGVCSCNFTSTCSGANSNFACDWEITMDRGCQLQAVSCNGPQFCSTTASAFDCYASAFADPVTPPPTNTPIPTNTPRPGCTCGPCGVCLSPGTYTDSCGNAGACTCCGTTTSPTPTTPISCPACCWPGLCQGTRYADRDGLCGGGTECCDSCQPLYPTTGTIRVWVFYDSNKNNIFDSGDQILPSIVSTSNARLRIHLTSYSDTNMHELQLETRFSGAWRNVSGVLIENRCSGNWDNWNGCGGSNEVCCNENPSFFNTCIGRCDNLGTQKQYTGDDSWSNGDVGDIFFQWHPFWGYYKGYTDRMVSFDWGGYVGPALSSWNSINYEVLDLPSQYKVSLIKSQDPRDISRQTTVYDQTSLIGGTIRGAGNSFVATQLVVIGIQDTDPPPNIPPTSPSLVISNVSNVTVTAVSGRNHICQDEFRLSSNSRRVKFWVSASDVDGANDIATIALRFNNNNGATEYMRLTAINLNTASPSYLPISGGGNNASIVGFSHQSAGNVRIAIFTVEFNQNYVPYLYDLDIYAQDVGGEILTWTDAGRDFKVWDCQVPVSGTVYDASGVSVNCPTVGYSTAVETGYFSGLIFDDTTIANVDKTMTSSSPDYSSSVGNHLIWGVSYTAIFADLLGTDPGNRRITDLVDNSVSCSAVSNDRTVIINESSGFDAYNIGSADVDFTTVANQDPWWQGRGVSILGRTSVRSDVPVTCTGSCVGALTIDNTSREDNGVVMSSRLNDSVALWGINNNWYQGSYDQNMNTLDYTTMFNSLNGEVGVRTATNWAGVRGVGGTGVVFVDRHLTIDVNNSVTAGKFLMVVVDGNIIINDTVTTVEGAYIANGDIIIGAVGGTNTSPLNINGMIYATGDIVTNRGFVDPSVNNNSPAVRVNIRPDLIFNAPSYMFERLSYIR